MTPEWVCDGLASEDVGDESGARRTPVRAVRVDQELWDAFDEAVRAAGNDDRAAVLRQFMRWYVGQPGVSFPQRPVD